MIDGEEFFELSLSDPRSYKFLPDLWREEIPSYRRL